MGNGGSGTSTGCIDAGPDGIVPGMECDLACPTRSGQGGLVAIAAGAFGARGVVPE